MTKYTTIQITKDLKNRLNELKQKTGRSRYDEVIEDLLAGGKIINDVYTIQREPVALNLRYFTIDKPDEFKIIPITYKDLLEKPVGTKFQYDCPSESIYSETAEILYKNDNEVILRETRTAITEKGVEFLDNILHIRLY